MSAPDDARKEEEIARAFGRETAIIEAAVQALLFDDFQEITNPSEELHRVAHRVLAAVTPMIRAAALEEAARAFEPHEDGHDSHSYRFTASEVAAAIRALKEQP